MAEFMTGDAFQEDRISEKIYGLPITSGNHSVTFGCEEETPEPMCNTVSFMKQETLNPQCRNVVAVSESYVCYTVKKTKLRVIHTESSKLALFQGHDFPIVDLKFSQVDRSFFCSVDDSLGSEIIIPATPRAIIRQLKFDTELDSIVLAQFPVAASMVQPHPKIAHVFAIAKGNRVGVISGIQKNIGGDSWDGLALNTIMSTNITDISFSTCGTKLIVVTAMSGQSDVVIITLPDFEHLSLGSGRLIKSEQRRLHAQTVWSDILSVICLPCGILTASRVPSASESAVKGMRTIQLQLLSMDSTTGYMDIIQSVKVTIPVHPSSSKVESINDIKLAFKKRGNDDIDFIILCHRSSHILACIALDVRRKLLPLCHLTFFDLKWPVFSLDSTHISGRNYYSNEQVDHLEIACYQVQDTKHAVHQYHFDCSSLYSFDAVEHESGMGITNITRNFSSKSILEILKTPPENVSREKAESFSVQSNTISAKFDIPALVVQPQSITRLEENPVIIGSSAEELVWSEIEQKSNLSEDRRRSHHSVESEQEELPPLPEILRTNAVQGRSIMSMLTKLKSEKAIEPVVVVPTSVLVPPSMQAFIPVSLSARSSVSASLPISTLTTDEMSSPVVTVASNLDAGKSDVSPVTVVRLMTGLYDSLFTEVSPAAEVHAPTPPTLVVTPTMQSSENIEFEVAAMEQDGEDDWEEASAAVAVTARRNTPTATTLVGRDALDHALQRSSIQTPSTSHLFQPQINHIDTALHEKINDLTKGMFSMVECISDMRSSASSTPLGTDKVSELCAQLEAEAVKKNIESKKDTEQAMKTFKNDLINEMKILLESSSIKSQREVQALKMEAAALNAAQVKETVLAVTKAVKSCLDSDMKTSMEVTYKLIAAATVVLYLCVYLVCFSLSLLLLHFFTNSYNNGSPYALSFDPFHIW